MFRATLRKEVQEKAVILFKFQELPENVREKVREEFISTVSNDYDFHEECKALNTLGELLDVTFDVSFDESRTYYKKVKYTKENYYSQEEELSGLRLRTWVINNYYKYLVTPKRYHIRNNWNKKRFSKIKQERDGCHITGLYLDDCLTKPIFDFLDNPRPKLHYNYLDLCDDILDAFVKQCQNEYEYRYSDDFIIDTADCWNLLFGADGTFYYEIDQIQFDLERIETV